MPKKIAPQPARLGGVGPFGLVRKSNNSRIIFFCIFYQPKSFCNLPLIDLAALAWVAGLHLLGDNPRFTA